MIDHNVAGCKYHFRVWTESSKRSKNVPIRYMRTNLLGSIEGRSQCIVSQYIAKVAFRFSENPVKNRCDCSDAEFVEPLKFLREIGFSVRRLPSVYECTLRDDETLHFISQRCSLNHKTWSQMNV